MVVLKKHKHKQRNGGKTMARKRMVTRTIISTVATCMCVNVEQGECINLTVEAAGTFTSEEKLLRAIKSTHESPTVKFVQVVEQHEKETLYGMEEQKFIEQAEILPPDHRKKQKQKQNKEVNKND